MTRMCEDAPCCGCCGTDIYGTNQSGPDEAEWYYCDGCGYNHRGPCPDDDPDYDPDYDEDFDRVTEEDVRQFEPDYDEEEYE